MLTLTLAMHVDGRSHGALSCKAHAALLRIVAFVLPVSQLGPFESQHLLDLLQSIGLVDLALEEGGAGFHDCKDHLVQIYLPMHASTRTKQDRVARWKDAQCLYLPSGYFA